MYLKINQQSNQKMQIQKTEKIMNDTLDSFFFVCFFNCFFEKIN